MSCGGCPSTCVHTGMVLRLPTAVLAIGFMLLSFFSVACDLILDSEAKRIVYAAMRAPGQNNDFRIP